VLNHGAVVVMVVMVMPMVPNNQIFLFTILDKKLKSPKKLKIVSIFVLLRYGDRG
jgi:hypothetical protein